MRSIILISEDRVKTVSNLDNNVFGKWLLPAIREAQDVNLQSIIGSTLYNQILTLVDSGDIALPEYELYKDLLDNQIADFLIYQSLVNVIPLINVNMANMGTVISNDEHIQTLSQGNVDLVRGYYQNLADIYQKRLQDFLKCHREYFPELNDCACDNCGVKPNLNSNTNTSGIWLGGLRNPKKVRGTSGCCGGTSKGDGEYKDGFDAGVAFQKNKLASTAFTENGEYQREDGWNSVSVNVPTGTGHTDEELEQAYQSGYTSGETHQKSLLVATAFTENGEYQRENGWSGVTVNVPQTGQTIHNQIMGTTLNRNGFYQFTYQSGYTGLERVDVTVDVPQTGYTQEDLDNAYQSGKTDQKNLLVATAVTENGTYSRENGYSSITVNVPQTGYTQEDLNNAYNRGYNDGLSDCGQSNRYLTFEVTGDGIINWMCSTSGTTSKTIQYSLNNGAWTNLISTTGGTSISVVSGDVVHFKGNNNTYSESITDYNSFRGTTTEFKVYGNIMSLVDGENFATLKTIPNNYMFNSLFFNCTGLTDASNLIIPATTLTSWCYHSMFAFCRSLITTPSILPATTLSDNCYYDMFRDCTNLTQVPALPATTLAEKCYWDMFASCTSLTTAPALPATTLADDCYGVMFQDCVSLTTAPELPATTLAAGCYRSMFINCTGLTTAPELSATTLARSCYNGMFRGCKSLTQAPALPATTLAPSCYQEMFANCTGLTSAPALPATALTNNCYYGMFSGCTGLTQAPALPATTLATSCYSNMFSRCYSLTQAPVLPATTLADVCYMYMFQDCTSLIQAPALPATFLTQACYESMFSGCTSLISAPALPATTLAKTCYKGMFNGCTSLNYIKCLATDISATECTYEWVNGTASSGTFIKNSNTNWERGVNGIPDNWTVQNNS